MSVYVAPSPRGCPFAPNRHTWAVYKVGVLWRVLRPSRVWACHESDSWVGDFASHETALRFATDPRVREAFADSRALEGLKRFAVIEGYAADCNAHLPYVVNLFGAVRDAA